MRPITLVSVMLLSTSCAVPSEGVEQTASAEQAVGTPRHVLFFDDKPVAQVRVTALGNAHIDLHIDAVLDTTNFYQWIDASWTSSYVRKDGAISSADHPRSARPFSGFRPIDVVVSSGDPGSFHVIVSGDLQPPRESELQVPALVPSGTGIPSAFQTVCGGNPNPCSLVSNIRLVAHGTDVTTELEFTGTAEQLAFDPAALGAISETASSSNGELTARLFSLTLPEPRVVDAGSIVTKQGVSTRTVTLAGAFSAQ